MECISRRRHIAAFAYLLLCVLALTAMSSAQVVDDPVRETAEIAEDGRLEADPALATVQAMGLRERVAQLMFVTLEGRATPNAEDRALLDNYTPGGVLIPTIDAPPEAIHYTTTVRGRALAAGVPLWVGANMFTLSRTDRDTLSQFMQIPSLLALAAVNDAEDTRFVADLVGEFLATMGFDLHLGPPLDRPPVLDGVAGTIQSLGSDPVFAGDAAACFLDALDEHGVLTVLTGFPGGRANRRGKTPAVLLTPKPLLADRDLFPFARAIEHGARMLHVAPVLVPTLDPANRPACMSQAVMGELLRGQMGFEGVILAGPLDEAHIGAQYDFAEAAILALEAGADMLYWNTSGRRVIRVVDEIVKAVNSGRLREQVVNDALQRALSLKFDQGIRNHEAPREKDAEKLNEDRRNVKDVGRIERRSITLVRNRDGLLPLSRDRGTPVGVTGVFGVRELNKILVKELESVIMQPLSTVRHLGVIEDFEIHRATTRLKAMQTVVVLLSQGLRPAGVRELIHGFKEKGVRVVAVLLGYPDMLPALSEADAVLLAYCHPSSYVATVPALADALLGRGPVAVRHEAGDIRLSVGQTRLFSALNMIRTPVGRLPVGFDEPFPAGLSVAYDPSGGAEKGAMGFRRRETKERPAR